jgi:hypothetical protein
MSFKRAATNKTLLKSELYTAIFIGFWGTELCVRCNYEMQHKVIGGKKKRVRFGRPLPP